MRQLLNHRLLPIGAILAGLVLLGASVYFLYNVYQRIEVRLLLATNALQVDGVVTEKLIQTRQEQIPPVTVTVYHVRYAFVTPEGRMQAGTQDVTRKVFEALPEQGGPTPIIFMNGNPGINAVGVRPAFPDVIGWRLAIALILLSLGGASMGFGLGAWRQQTKRE